MSVIVDDLGAGGTTFEGYPRVFAAVVDENRFLSNDLEQKIDEVSSMLVDFTEESAWIDIPYESMPGNKFWKYTDGSLTTITADTYSCQYTSIQVIPGEVYKVKTWLKS